MHASLQNKSNYFSDTEIIVLGGGNYRDRMVEKYDIDGNMVEELPSFRYGR